MNFLGHLYFSNDVLDLMIANLFGDSVKGNKYLNYSSKIQQGVLLHRKIDFYIDNHDLVKELRLELYKELPKVAGIAIDLYFDHLLAIHWNSYHYKPFESFLDEFYMHRSKYEVELNIEFRLFLERLREHKWINHYPSLYGLEQVCLGVSKRLSFKNKLPEAPLVFSKHNIKIENVFHQFMNDAKNDLANQV